MSASNRYDEQITSDERYIIDHIQNLTMKHREAKAFVDTIRHLQDLAMEYWNAYVKYCYGRLKLRELLNNDPWLIYQGDFVKIAPNGYTYITGYPEYDAKLKADIDSCDTALDAFDTAHQAAFGTRPSINTLQKIAREEMSKVFLGEASTILKNTTKDNFFDKAKSHQSKFIETVNNQILLPSIAKKRGLEGLEKYIARIDGYKETSEGYQTGFRLFCAPIMAESRGLNREATHLLAIYLRDKIINGLDISDDMRNLRQIRELLMQEKYGSKVSLRDINSTEFNDAANDLKQFTR